MRRDGGADDDGLRGARARAACARHAEFISRDLAGMNVGPDRGQDELAAPPFIIFDDSKVGDLTLAMCELWCVRIDRSFASRKRSA